MKMANVQVVGFDGSTLGEVALHRALRAAEGAELPTVHVVMVARKVSGGVCLPSGAILSRFEALMTLRLTVGALVQQWRISSGFVRIVCHLMVGDPVTCIVEVARDSDAERILLGAHGMQAAKPGHVGSVARKVAQSATREVILQTLMNAGEERSPTDPLRLFLLLGDGFSAERLRQSPRIANC